MIKHIYILWLQGFDHAPHIITKTLETWVNLNPTWKIHKIDSKNLDSYIDITPYLAISNTNQSKIITNQSLSDLIRILLLRKYGGLWVDATLICKIPLDVWITPYIKKGFFILKQNTYDRIISSWFIYAEKENYIIKEWCNKTIEYVKSISKIGSSPSITIDKWNKGDLDEHYFWFHYLFGDLYNTNTIFKRYIDSIPDYMSGPVWIFKHTNIIMDQLTKNTQNIIDNTNVHMFKFDQKKCYIGKYKNSVLEYMHKSNLSSRDTKYMNITFIFDFSYIDKLLTVVNSIIQNENPENIKNIRLYLTFFGTHEEMLNLNHRMNYFFSNPKITYYIKNIQTDFPDIFKLCNQLYDIKTAHKQIQTSLVYARMYLPQIWKDITDILLYLDLDIIVLKPISELFDTIFNNIGYEIYACPNQYIKCNFNFNINISSIIDNNELFKNKYSNSLLNKIKNISKKLDNYNDGFNGGLWALDMDKCRKYNFTKLSEICMYINSIKKYFNHNGQSIMNFVFVDKFFKLDNNWNYMARLDESHHNSINCGFLKINDNFAQVVNDAKLIHFNGQYKPWNTTNKDVSALWNKYNIEYNNNNNNNNNKICVCYIHIGKCSGSTIRNYIQDKNNYYDTKNILFDKINIFHLVKPVEQSNLKYIIWIRNPLCRFVSAFNYVHAIINTNIDDFKNNKISSHDILGIVYIRKKIKTGYAYTKEYEELVQYFKTPNTLAESITSNDINIKQKALQLMNDPIEHIYKGIGWYLDNGNFIEKYHKNILFVGKTETISDDIQKLSNVLNVKHNKNYKSIRINNVVKNNKKYLSELAITNLLEFYRNTDYKALKALEKYGFITSQTLQSYYTYNP